MLCFGAGGRPDAYPTIDRIRSGGLRPPAGPAIVKDRPTFWGYRPCGFAERRVHAAVRESGCLANEPGGVTHRVR